MRITQQTMHSRVLTDLAATQERIARTQQQISTGRTIQKPSDDVAGTRTLLARRSEIEQLSRHEETAKLAAGWTEATDTALQQVTDLVHRARELVVQASSSTANAANRRSIAAEVRQLIDGARDTINVRHGDQYLFAGTSTTSPPYAAGSDAYAGDSGVVAREIGPGVSVQVNTLGSEILGSGQTAADGRLLDVLRDVVDHLEADDVGALGGTDLRRLEENLDRIGSIRATNGATQNRVEAAAWRLADLEVLATQRLSEVQDTDFGKAILDLNAQSSAYQAALKTASTVIQPSLLDFLR